MSATFMLWLAGTVPSTCSHSASVLESALTAPQASAGLPGSLQVRMALAHVLVHLPTCGQSPDPGDGRWEMGDLPPVPDTAIAIPQVVATSVLQVPSEKEEAFPDL